MSYWHALPDGWEDMEYEDFLRERREMIAAIVQDAYGRFDKGAMGQAPQEEKDIVELISEGENGATEFKSTLRRNLHTGDNDVRMENSALKTIVGFLNSKGGGTLFIGVTDDGVALGVEADSFKNEDKMYLHLNNLIKDRIGAKHMLYIHPHFDDFEDKRVLVVECLPARSPVYLKEGNEERFYIRSVAATVELKGGQAQDFIAQRF
jgi:predicted HTH transcriptional regulator